jgi:hypothetical protein
MTGHDLAITRWQQYWKRATRTGHAFAEVSGRFQQTKDPFWTAESKGNRSRALQISTLFLAGIAGSILMRSVWPFVLICLLFALLAVRSAWRARWKSNDRVALLLYGVHSHVQQIPIYLGQLQYRWNRRKGKRSMLLDYK